MDAIATLDAAGRQRSPATLPGYHAGRAPRNKGRKYPADPPRVEEIVAVMRQAGERPAGVRFRGLAVVLWRAGKEERWLERFFRASPHWRLANGHLTLTARGSRIVMHHRRPHSS
jgi:hypothetical protein